MVGSGKAALMRIYTDERAKSDDGPLYQTIVERARAMPVAGLTVLRGVVGFGASGHVQRASILDLSGNLPLVIELVDEDATLRSFWHKLQGLSDIGLVTLEDIEVLHYGGDRALGAEETSFVNKNVQSSVQAYRVWRKSHDQICYYLLASSPYEAIEVVTMRLVDLEGIHAWAAEADKPAFDLKKGHVVDRAGKDVVSLNL